jgi:hypothetical protein
MLLAADDRRAGMLFEPASFRPAADPKMREFRMHLVLAQPEIRRVRAARNRALSVLLAS